MLVLGIGGFAPCDTANQLTQVCMHLSGGAWDSVHSHLDPVEAGMEAGIYGARSSVLKQ